MCKKIYNPKEAIGLLLYAEPKNAEFIKNKMYGKRNSKVPKWIKELKDNNKIIPVVSKDSRYYFYQTNPKTLLNYIINTLIKREKFCNCKKYEISLTSEEKTKVLQYCKSPKFLKFVKEFVNNIDVKSEHFTYSGLMELFSWECITTLAIYSYINRKLKPEDFKNILSINKDNESLEFMLLGRELLSKLSNLNIKARWVFNSYEKVIVGIESINASYIKKLKERIKELTEVKEKKNGFRC